MEKYIENEMETRIIMGNIRLALSGDSKRRLQAAGFLGSEVVGLNPEDPVFSC